nr:pyridoxal-dependent decarboxylase [uncultured Lichenicoccus sp.]
MSGLDPEDWSGLRALGHRMLDDMIDRLAHLREQPVWQHMPDALRDELRVPLPEAGSSPEAIYADFQRLVAPYSVGNTHPRFMGWVHGGGTGIGMLAELLAGGLNANLGGRDHAPIEVERQVVRWAAEMVGMPAASSGLLVTGSSMANMIAVLVARRGMRADPTCGRMASAAGAWSAMRRRSAHGCIPRAFDLAGLGTAALRTIGCDPTHGLDIEALRAAVARDRNDGLQPFIVVATAGTVDTGSIDDLAGLAEFCAAEGLWFHVDGAFGALAALSPRLRQRLAGIERADSLAFDFHKWAQVPYDAGCIVVRDPTLQAQTFAQSLAYLAREDRGTAGNAPWPADLGPDLSRGFRALKVWMTLRTYGSAEIGRMVERCCALAAHLEARVLAEPELELLAPVSLNIVCFRVRHLDASRSDPDRVDWDRFNSELVKDLQESGIAVPSTTMIGGRRAIRAAIVNHRTETGDIDMMVDALLRLAAARGACAP